jgi:hypothetical protein
MQAAARSNLVLIDSSVNWFADLQKQISPAEFYQQLTTGLIRGIYTKQVLNDLGNRLRVLAEQAYRLRRVDVVEQASQFLLHLPLSKEYRSVGRYYETSCLHIRGRFAEERVRLEHLIEKLPPQFKAKALVSLSATYAATGDFQSFLSLCIEAGRAAIHRDSYDLQSFILSHRNIAVIKSIDGNHHGALTDLDRIFPMARAISRWHPYLYYEHLNSLAVELCALGRPEEARNVCKIVLASPYADAYPEWRETSDEVEWKAYRSPRSFTSFNHSLLNTKNVVLYLSVPGPSDTINSEKYHRNPFQQGSVTILEDWKRKMVKEPNGDKNDKDELKNANEKDLYLKLMELMAKRDLSSKQLRRVIDFVEKISSEPDPKDD